jgi:hypothetical protein
MTRILFGELPKKGPNILGVVSQRSDWSSFKMASEILEQFVQ